VDNRWKLLAYAGNSFKYIINLSNSENTAAYDLTDHKIQLTIKERGYDKDINDADAIYKGDSTGTDISITNPADGKFEINIPGNITSDWPLEQLYYELEIINASDEVIDSWISTIEVVSKVRKE